MRNLRKQSVLAAVLCGLWIGTTVSAKASLIVFYTEDSAFGAGSATRSDENHTIQFSGGNNDVTITFNPISHLSPTTVNTPQSSVDLGTFSLTETSNGNAGTPTNPFTLQITEMPPVGSGTDPVGSGTDPGTIAGTFKLNKPGDGEIDFASNSIVIGSVTYALLGLTGSNNALFLNAQDTVTLRAKPTGGPSTTGDPPPLAAPEPSTMALAATGVLMTLGYARYRRKR